MSIDELPAYHEAWRPDWDGDAFHLAHRLRDPIWRHAPAQPWRTALRYAFGWWGLCALRHLVLRNGSPPPRVFVDALAGLLAAVPLAAKRTAARNLAIAFPETSTAWRCDTLRRFWRVVVRTLLDTLEMERLTAGDLLQRVEVVGESHLFHAHGRGRGVIALTAHYGPFPFGFARLGVAGWPVAVMVRRQKDAVFEGHWKRLRDRFGVFSIPHRPPRLSVRLALQHLRTGGILYLAGDQKAPGAEPFVPFFGRRVHTHGLPARLSLHTGAPILPCFVEADGDGGSRAMTLRIEPPLQPTAFTAHSGADRTGAHPDKAAAAEGLLRAYHQRLEAAIQRAPTSWWWLHNRFHRWPEAPTTDEPAE